MSENLHEIDDLFRDGIEGHEEMPPAAVWEAIDKGLDKSSVVAIRRKYDHLRKLAVALVIVLAGTVSWALYHAYSNNELAAGKQVKKSLAPTGDNASEPNETAATATGELTANNKKHVSNHADTSVASVAANSEKRKNASLEKIAATQKQAEENLPAATETTLNNSDKKTKAQVNYSAKSLPKNSEASEKENVFAAGNNVAAKNGTTAFNKPKKTASAAKNAPQKSIQVRETPRLADVQGENDMAASNEENAGAASTSLNAAWRHRSFENMIASKKSIQTLAGFYNGSLLDEHGSAEAAASSFVVPKMKQRRLSVTASFGPQFTKNNIKEEHHNGPIRPDHDRDEIRRAEDRPKSYSVALLVNYALNNHWSLQTGLGYTTRNTSIDGKMVYARPDASGEVKYRFECSSGYGFLPSKTALQPRAGDSTVVGDSRNELAYINLPLSLQYTVAAGKFHIVPAAGLSANFLSKQKLETALTSGGVKSNVTINNLNGLKSMYLSGQIGLGLDYAITRKLGIGISPAFNFGLESINKNAVVKSYASGFGINTSLRLSF